MDKTGTLTTDKLKIRSMVISGKIFWFKDRDQKKMETYFKLDPLFDKDEITKEMHKTAREVSDFRP
jgi:magnesium-transporting ATPase (P-type)